MTKDRDINIPSTISDQAKGALQELIKAKPYQRTTPAADDLAGWKEMHDGCEALNEEESRQAIARNKVTVTKEEMGGVTVGDIRPENWSDNGKVLVYVHGGAFTLFSARSTFSSSAPMVKATGLRTITVNYTDAPVAQWQEIQGQVLSVVKVLRETGYGMQDIAMLGDSAGGGLVTSTILNLRDQGMGMPAVAALWAPWVDLTNTGDSAFNLAGADVLIDYDGVLKNSAEAYAGGVALDDPRVSPLYADFTKGFSPCIICAGTKEIFLSTAVRLYQKLEAAGQRAKLDVYEGMWHVFQRYPMPESECAITKSARFINDHLK